MALTNLSKILIICQGKNFSKVKCTLKDFETLERKNCIQIKFSDKKTKETNNICFLSCKWFALNQLDLSIY